MKKNFMTTGARRLFNGLLMLGAALLAHSSGAAEPRTIKLATVSPLSGEIAQMGEMIKLGAQLAVEELGPELAAKGLRLELAPQDDQANPDVGTGIARRLVNDPDVMGVVGHLNSGVAIPASEIYKDYSLVMVSPANTATIVTDRGYATVNRVCGRDDVQGPAGAEFAATTLKVKKVFVVHDKTAYGQGVAQAFADASKKKGLKVLGFVGTEERANFQSLVLQMRALRPDLVYFGGTYAQAAVLVKQMRDRSIKALYMSDDAIDSEGFVRIAGPAARDVYYSTVAGPGSEFPAAKAFGERFARRFKRMPEGYAIYAYDAAHAIIAAIKQAGPDRAAVAQAVRRSDFEGITGKIAFDDKGDRRLADYFIIHLADGSYPGQVVRKIAMPAPPRVH